MLNSLEIQRNSIKLLWDQNVHNVKEISNHLFFPLRTCEQYVSLLCKTGNLSISHSLGRPRKLVMNQHRHIGKMLKHNHFTTISEMKVKLEENNSDLEVSECTIRHELQNLGYVSVLSRKVPLLTQKAKDIRLS